MGGAGYATLRISTRGTGGSSGSHEDMTIEGRIEEAMAAVAWLAKQTNIDPHRIGIVGYNQGAIVATAAAGRMHGKQIIKSIALWMPIIDPLFYYANRSGVSQLAKGLNAKEGELVSLTTKSKTPRSLKNGFYRDIWTISPAAELRSFDGSMLVVMGTKEAEDVPTASADNLLRYHRGRHELVLFPTDQGIGVFEDSKTLDELAAQTLDWFRKQL
jgi:dipeptidyl aminopeptidase/acylaminoacyl peptidase